MNGRSTNTGRLLSIRGDLKEKTRYGDGENFYYICWFNRNG
jgi:hypothetical protein